MNDNIETIKETTATPMDDLDANSTATNTQETPLYNISEFMESPEVKAFIKNKIAEGIQKALAGETPKANTTKATAQEKATFDRMTYKERLQLFQSNPQAYYKLREGN